MTLKASENTVVVPPAADTARQTPAVSRKALFDRHAAANPFLGDATFDVRPVFGAGPGQECAFENEMLAVTLVRNGKVTPLDLVPVRSLHQSSVEKAALKLQAAFLHACREMKVEFRDETRDQMAGWHIKSAASGKLDLEFIREGFGVERVEAVLLSRTREHAHLDLDCDLGLNHYYVVKSLSPEF